MTRAPLQILVLPYRPTEAGDWEFAVFNRSDSGGWQGIAGGGEGMETALEAARREAFEEAGIPANASFLRLDTTASIRVTCFPESEIWGEDRFVVPEHAFGVEVASERVSMSTEHVDVRWLPFADAEALLRFDSNRTALWELNQRIRGLGPRDIPDGRE